MRPQTTTLNKKRSASLRIRQLLFTTAKKSLTRFYQDKTEVVNQHWQNRH